MTVYVDNARIPATVGRIRGRWSHLFADTQDELHAFALSIGLKRAWFQPGRAYGGKPSRHWHYDVTESMRQRAIRAGAKPVNDPAEYMAIVNRREQLATVTEAVRPDVTTGCHGSDMTADLGTAPGNIPRPPRGCRPTT